MIDSIHSGSYWLKKSNTRIQLKALPKERNIVYYYRRLHLILEKEKKGGDDKTNVLIKEPWASTFGVGQGANYPLDLPHL